MPQKKPKKARKKQVASTSGTVQIQVYAPPELVKWLDQDCASCQDEIQAERGQQQQLSRSAYIVAVLHQYSLTKSLHDTGADAPGSFRDYWLKTNAAVKPGKKKRTK